MRREQEGKYDSPMYSPPDCRVQIVVLLYMILGVAGFTVGMLIGRGL